MIRGEKIYLRIVKQSDLALLESWNNNPDFQGEFNDFGLRPAGSLEKRFAEDGLLSARFGELLVVNDDDEVVGTVSYHQERCGPNEGSVRWRRGVFGLVLWEFLPADARERTVRDLAGALRGGLVADRQALAVGPIIGGKSTEVQTQIRALLAMQGVRRKDLIRLGLPAE